MIGSIRRKWQFAAALIPIVICLSPLAAVRQGAMLNAQSCAPTWTTAYNATAADNGLYLNSVAVAADNDAWAVGQYTVGANKPAVLHWDGSNVVKVTAPDPSSAGSTGGSKLLAVTALAPDNVWAVGTQAQIVASAGTKIEAVQTLTQHWDGASWRVVSSPNRAPDKTNILNAVSGSAADDVWAVGQVQVGTLAQPLAMRWNGTAWSDVTIPGISDANTTLAGVAALDKNNAWAVGSYLRGTESGAIIEHWDGRAWSMTTIPATPSTTPRVYTYLVLRGIAPNGPNDIWAVGSNVFQRLSSDGKEPPVLVGLETVIYHWNGTSWSRVPSPNPGNGGNLFGVTTTASNSAVAVGYYLGDRGPTGLALRWDGSAWSKTADPAQSSLLAVAAVRPGEAWAAGTGTLARYNDPCPSQAPMPAPNGQNPAARVPNPNDPNATYFEPVGHTLRGAFHDYWQANGGLAQFGYPLTEEFQEKSPTDGKTYTVQYFERNRFEYHPVNEAKYRVLLGLLGRSVTTGRQDEAPFRALTSPPIAGRFFDATGHALAPQFAAYWDAHGGLPVYGYPISESFTETSPTDGKPYLVQYFERNRLEYHPELGEQYRISLGLLGVQLLKERGWIN